MNLKLLFRNSSLAEIWPRLVLIAVSLPLLLFRLADVPRIWFDEGYKLNAARTFLEHGFFGTYTVDGYRPFDPGISSGPLDVIPTAVSFAILGQGVTQARLVAITYTLIALLSLYTVAAFLYGHRLALIVVFCILLVPPATDASFLWTGRQALSEAPALCWIATGLLTWFRSWDQPSWPAELFAGFAIGAGLLSKSQIGISLMPALLIVTAGRYFAHRPHAYRDVVMLSTAFGVIAAWLMLGRLVTPEDIRLDNSQMLLEALRSNIFTDLYGKGLRSVGWLVAAFMAFGSLTAGFSWARRVRRQGQMTNVDWAELVLVLFTLGSLIWFVGLSVGWPRYSYAGLTASVLLLGRAIGDLTQFIGRRLKRLQVMSVQSAHRIAVAGLIGAVLLVNGVPLVMTQPDDSFRQAVEYINREIAPTEVIETWEWELSALSQHSAFHHPHQRFLFLAIRQFSQQQPFDLSYNVLEADPDYLIIGNFSQWTGIYASTSTAHFTEVARFGAYRIYQRLR